MYEHEAALCCPIGNSTLEEALGREMFNMGWLIKQICKRFRFPMLFVGLLMEIVVWTIP